MPIGEWAGAGVRFVLVVCKGKGLCWYQDRKGVETTRLGWGEGWNRWRFRVEEGILLKERVEVGDP